MEAINILVVSKEKIAFKNLISNIKKYMLLLKA